VLPGGTYREDYVVEALAYGWRCPNRPACGECRGCGAPRPRKDTVQRNTKGKR
jgi:hypothetical protein